MTKNEPSVMIPSLPGLGTTWYRRGPRYWLRRTFSALLLLTALAFFCYIALRLYLGAPRSDMPPGMRRVWDVTQVIASCAAIVWGWVKARRDLRRQLLDPPLPDAFRAARRAGAPRARNWSRAGLIPLLLAAPVLPPLAAWCVGWFAASLTVRHYPSEVGARRWLEEHSAGT
ncbi:hypothetical protein BIV25_15165 [Streptomyces sp. MUSC 14]|uniref:hypothetical protein n=1 Tax=Streptomyces sp. MUSC 14 TaxID=1354889 RepID=UPI0008F568D8|nr:hypothetical protein [Streptomyces sp. MUSC 14]OIJ97564.1 hypothetical protein BIV25_15165 [Streptomyces sp. MUSC 14]